MNSKTFASTTHATQTKIPLSSSQCAQVFATLQNALQAGDLAAARRAYAVFCQDVAAQAGPACLFLPNAQTGHDLQTLGNSLNGANMPGAKRAFAMFLMDMLHSSPSTPIQVLHASRP
jgi:hypothetical protein